MFAVLLVGHAGFSMFLIHKQDIDTEIVLTQAVLK